MVTDKAFQALEQKILAGFALSGKRLLEKKQREDATVVIFRDGRIQTIRAREYEPPTDSSLGR